MQSVRACRRPLHRWIAAFAVLALLGCERQPPGPYPVKKRSPEESFARIVEEVRRLIGGDSVLSGAGVSGRPNVITSQTTERKIVDELAPPSDENDSYTGRITVESKTTFAAASMPHDNDENEDDSKTENGSKHDLSEPGEDGDDSLKVLADLSGDKASSKDEEGNSPTDSPRVRQFTHDHVATIELRYVDDKWVIESKIEDGGMLAVFESALNRQ